MADTTNLENFLTDIADSIRNKTGETNKILAANFDTEINNIDTVNNQSKTTNPTTTEVVVEPDEGYTGLSSVTISAVDSSIDSNITADNIKSGVKILDVTGTVEEINSQIKTVNPTTEIQTVTPDEEYNSLSSVTVNAVNATIDKNITTENIKKDVTILGVTGTLEETTINNQDKTATPSTEEQTVTYDEGYTGLESVFISAVDASIDGNIIASNIKKDVEILGVTGTLEETTINNQDKTVTPSTSQQTTTFDDGYTGLGTVTTEAVTSSIDSDIKATNILQDVDILGVTGTLDFTNFQAYIEARDTAYNILGGSYTPTEKHIYGVKRLLDTSDTTWERTDDSVNFTAIACLNGDITSYYSDFDDCYPWSAINSYLYDKDTNVIVAEYGDEDFTFTPESSSVNVLTRIPQMWIQRYQDDEYEYIKIADYAAEGFTEFSERSIGRYMMSNSTTNPRSMSGTTPMYSQAATNMRTYAQTLGNEYSLWDIWTLSMIQCLYLVEFADNNTQNTLGLGVSSGSRTNSGGCNGLGMKSGCVANAGATSMIYRGIEDWYGNEHQIIDGINYISGVAYVCDDYQKYAFGTTTNYTKLGITSATSSEYITTMGCDENYPTVMFPTAVGGSSTTYYPDYFYYSSGTYVYYHGGNWGYGSVCGGFCAYCNSAASFTFANLGGRFQYNRQTSSVN